MTQALPLLDTHPSDFVLADRSYDAAAVVDYIEAHAAIPVIPSNPQRKRQRWYDTFLYRERHAIECFVNKLKHYRHVFSRFDKLAARYLAFVYFVATLIWLR